jgi:hypothetical protein
VNRYHYNKIDRGLPANVGNCKDCSQSLDLETVIIFTSKLVDADAERGMFTDFLVV